MKILLIEDDDVHALCIERWLRPHKVVRVCRASEAMAIIRDGFDLILCDMGLPDATDMGEASTTVTEILAASQIPLIKISGKPRPGVIDKTEEAILDAIAGLQ